MLSSRANRMAERLCVAVSTLFYLGKLPFCPGTFASLAGFFVYLIIGKDALAFEIFTVAAVFTGFLVSSGAERALRKKDPGEIVIDELAGMSISLLFLPYSPKIAVIGLILFRVFDIAKPEPIKRLQKLKAGLGIMGDDILAGIYVNIVLQVLLRLNSFSIS